MTRKPPTPKTKPYGGRAVNRAYEEAIADSAEKIALLRGDPAAIQRQARKRAGESIDAVARTMPTGKLRKIVGYAKKGVR